MLVKTNELSRRWKTFLAQIKDVWTDLQDSDLYGSQDSMEQLIDCIRNGSEQTSTDLRRKVKFLVERFNVSFDESSSGDNDL